jgi:hypothetical protein
MVAKDNESQLFGATHDSSGSGLSLNRSTIHHKTVSTTMTSCHYTPIIPKKGWWWHSEAVKMEISSEPNSDDRLRM